MSDIKSQRSQAGVLAAIAATGGLIYWIRFRGTEARSASIAAADQSANAALDRKNDSGIQDTVKGAYGGKTGGHSSLGGPQKAN